LSHKNLVKLLGVSLDGSPIYIVTEFCGKVTSSLWIQLLCLGLSMSLSHWQQLLSCCEIFFAKLSANFTQTWFVCVCVYFLPDASLQIIFFYKPVICQARDKVWPDLQPICLDYKRRERNNVYRRALWTLF